MHFTELRKIRYRTIAGRDVIRLWPDLCRVLGFGVCPVRKRKGCVRLPSEIRLQQRSKGVGPQCAFFFGRRYESAIMCLRFVMDKFCRVRGLRRGGSPVFWN